MSRDEFRNQTHQNSSPMKEKSNPSDRRSFIKKSLLGAALVSSAPHILSRNYQQRFELPGRTYASKDYAAGDQVNLALIGSGIQGIYDTMTALQVSGVKLVAVCDLYTGRLERARELWGDDLFTTRDYREILERSDVDAVIVATPDHWHKRISVEALRAGKAVYCEKPMVQQFDEGHELISVQ